MLYVSEEQVKELLDYTLLIEELRNIFRSNFKMPLRHHHLYQSMGLDNALILMPSWNDEYLGVKQVIVAPENYRHNLNSIFAVYTLQNAQTGIPLLQMDAAYSTSFRTACTSALAASYLAPQNPHTLLIVGSGKVAEHLAGAHCAVRSYSKILVWARSSTKAQALVQVLKSKGHQACYVSDLEYGVRQADVISCATLSKEPIIKGVWLKKGVHLDLIGSHLPTTREVDDIAIQSGRIFVDSRIGAPHETGELYIPISNGLIKASDIQSDIVELCTRENKGRINDEENTIFKSAGLAIEDLAVALLIYKNLG